MAGEVSCCLIRCTRLAVVDGYWPGGGGGGGARQRIRRQESVSSAHYVHYPLHDGLFVQDACIIHM